MPVTMFDAVTIGEIPANPPAVAGYVGGAFPTYSQLVARFPKASHLSIAVNAGEDAECLDVETGDAIPSDAAVWYRRQVARGVKRPVFYADTSTMPAVIAALKKAKVARKNYRLWTAHYTNVAHIEPGSDATQWTDAAFGRNLDESECVDNFFTDPPAPKPVVNPPHYEWFPTGPFPSPWGKLNERKTVEAYDGARKHPILQAVYLKWVLEPRLQFLAARVEKEIKTNPKGNRVNRRGWRYRQLLARSKGQRFV